MNCHCADDLLEGIAKPSTNCLTSLRVNATCKSALDNSIEDCSLKVVGVILRKGDSGLRAVCEVDDCSGILVDDFLDRWNSGEDLRWANLRKCRIHELKEIWKHRVSFFFWSDGEVSAAADFTDDCDWLEVATVREGLVS